MAAVTHITSFAPPRRVLILDPEFVSMMDELKGLLRYTFQTEERTATRADRTTAIRALARTATSVTPGLVSRGTPSVVGP